MDTTHLGEIASLATAFLWTLSALSWTSAGKHIGALPVSFIRLLVACVYVMIYGLIVRGQALPMDADARTWLLLATSGFFGFFIADLCLFKAFLLIGPRISLLIQTLQPPLSQIIVWIFLGEKLVGKDWLGMAVTLAGVVWVLFEQPETPVEQHRIQHHKVLGIILALVCVLAGSIGSVLAKMGIGNYDAAGATLIRILGALVGFVAFITILGRWKIVHRATRHTHAMTIVMFGSFVGPFIGVITFMIALRYCQVGVVSTLVNTMPVMILPFVILLYHEKVSLRALFGAVIAILGVSILMK